MNILKGATLALDSLNKLNESMESLSNQPKTAYTIRELIIEGYEGIEKALKRHSYKVVAEKIAEDLKITLSEGTLKKYVSDARKKQEEDSKPATPATRKQKPTDIATAKAALAVAKEMTQTVTTVEIADLTPISDNLILKETTNLLIGSEDFIAENIENFISILALAPPLEPFISGTVKEWGSKTPEAIALKVWALKNKDKLYRYCRKGVNEEQSPEAIVNKFLRDLGIQTEVSRRLGSRGNQKRLYRATNPQDWIPVAVEIGLLEKSGAVSLMRSLTS